MCITIRLSGLEVSAILSWHEYVENNSASFGGFDPSFPLEQELVRKLENYDADTASFTETEIDIMCGWMNRTIFGKYGSEEYLFGYELRAAKKLKAREGILQ